MINGDDGNDVLVGGDGADTLSGGEDDDVLVGNLLYRRFHEFAVGYIGANPGHVEQRSGGVANHAPLIAEPSHLPAGEDDQRRHLAAWDWRR